MNELFDEFSDKIVLLDSRHYGQRFRNVYRKTNDIEAARLNQVEVSGDDVIEIEDLKQYAQNLYDQTCKPVFVTRGSRGLLVADDEGDHEIPGIQLLKKLDTVGAGDTALSALALSVAMAYLTDRPIWQRVVLVGMGVPVAVFANVLRVGITTVMFYLDKPELGQDFMHEFTGLLMLIPAALALWLIAWLMERLLG